MKQPVEVPNVGESVASGILANWFAKDGSFVNEGDEIFELETDKATLPIPSPASGTITIAVQENEEVEIGAVVAHIDTDATAPADSTPAPPPQPESKGAQPDSKPAPVATSNQTSPPPSGPNAPVSPAVRRILEENKLQPHDVATSVQPTGKDGRLTKADVETFLSSNKGSAKDAAVPSDDAQLRKPMTNLRKRIAENLVRSKRDSAHLTTFNEVDMSATMAMRSAHKEQFEKRHEIRLGFMSFFIKAATNALIDFPNVNAYVDGTDIIFNNFYSVGVAISTDAGLIVPVLRNADRMSFADIERAIVDFATRAKAKRILPDEFTGGTFTITNGGVFGSMLSTPIPSPPQTAVLGMHSITKRAVVVDDQIVIRPMMYLALTYDHRIIDGREAIGFLKRIKDQVEDPSQMLLGV